MRQQWSLSRIDQHDSRYEGIGRHFAKLAGSIVPIVMGQHNNGTEGAPWRSLQPRDWALHTCDHADVTVQELFILPLQHILASRSSFNLRPCEVRS